jgi:hypothetical protein
MKCYLVFNLTKRPLIKIGKKENSNLEIVDSTVDKEHAFIKMIRNNDGINKLILKDEGSKFGTFILL